jgi:hypothetical protein
VTNQVAMTSNAPPDLLTELYVAHYTGLVRLAAPRDPIVDNTRISRLPFP